MLLISKYCLDAGYFCQPEYGADWLKNTWEQSSLRKWLNTEFYERAFSGYEKSQIIPVMIGSQQELQNETVKDYVFLLSAKEVEQFFPENSMRKAFPTPHAIRNKAFLNYEDLSAIWWIMPYYEDHGFGGIYPQAVTCNGEFYYHGRNVGHGDFAVRPVIRVKKTVLRKHPEKKEIQPKIQILMKEEVSETGDVFCMEIKDLQFQDGFVHIRENFTDTPKYLMYVKTPDWSMDFSIFEAKLRNLELCMKNIVEKASAKSDIETIVLPLPEIFWKIFNRSTDYSNISDIALVILKTLNRSLYEQKWGRTVRTVKLVCNDQQRYRVIELLTRAISIADMSGYSSTANTMLEFNGNEELGEGWVAEEALAIGVCCALDGKGFEQNIRSAVGHRGDSDSTASIAGQIMGAYYGERIIPANWPDYITDMRIYRKNGKKY